MIDFKKVFPLVLAPRFEWFSLQYFTFHCQRQQNWRWLFLSLLTHILHILVRLWSDYSWKPFTLLSFWIPGLQKYCTIIHIMNPVKTISWLWSAAVEETFAFRLLVYAVDMSSHCPLSVLLLRVCSLEIFWWGLCIAHQHNSVWQALWPPVCLLWKAGVGSSPRKPLQRPYFVFYLCVRRV